jgi:hypothetical protein
VRPRATTITPVDRMRTATNVAIVLAIAAAIEFLPGGGTAGRTIVAVIEVGFVAGLAYMVARLYREHRVALYSLGDRNRALLYGASAVGLVTVAARTRMYEAGSFWEFLWFVLIGLVAYTFFAVYRFSRSY